jgi:YesN/AraC family two-component response regulator
MPECSGVDLAERLKGSGCEFVIISGYREFDESVRFFRLGGLDYILKPINDNDLQQLLDKLTAKLAVKKAEDNKQEDTTSSTALNDIIAYMKANIAGKITLESLSEAHHMTVNSICRLFTNQLGTTFLACLTKLRMEEAARLLRETKKDIKEISGLCGYSNYFYFVQVFGKHYLCTPTEFREAAK